MERERKVPSAANSPIIDAHMHFWRYRQEELAWIDSGGPLARDYLPAEVAPAMAVSGVCGGIAVQARHDEAETAWLIGLAADVPEVLGVVGWIDLQSPGAGDRLDALGHPRLVGLRHIVQDEPEDFLERPAFIDGVRAVARAGLVYDVLVYPHQASAVPRFLDAVGEGRFVLDHGAKPPIAASGWEPWASAVAAIARYPTVTCKISGLITEADSGCWQPTDFDRYLDHLLACFGPERLIWGSDWPLCQLSARYDAVLGIASSFVERACPGQADLIFGGTAQRVYRLPASRSA